MKKLLIAMLLLAGISTVGTNSFASDCRDVEFDDGNVCVNIEKVSGKTFKLTSDVTDGSSSLQCAIYLTSEEYNEVKTYGDIKCNGGTFTVPGLDTEYVKIFIKQGGDVPTDWDEKPSSDSKWMFPQWYYDFDEEEWADEYDSDSSSSSSSNGDLDNFYLTADDTSPDTNQRVDLTVKARDNDDDTVTDYDGDVDFTVYYRTSSSSSWTKTTSSTYFEIDDDSYSFRSSDRGVKTLTDLIRFKKSYDYKVVVTDNDEDITAYKIFYVDGSSSSSSSNGDLDDFTITLADSTPSEDTKVKLTIKAVDNDNDTLDDYDGANAEISVEYRTSSSSSWRNATSSYFSIDDSTPTFSNGSAYTYITFKSDYDYRITVTDDDDDDIYTQKIVYVDGGSSSSSSNGDLDDFTITLADSTPSEDTKVKLTIKAVDNDNDTLDDYDGANAEISVEYRTSSSSSWKDATSSYIAIDDTTPTFYNGSAYTYITFKSDYDYRITVTDDDDDSIYTQKIIYVDGGSSSSSSVDGFSSSELNTIEDLYDSWDTQITALRNSSSKLRNNTTRKNMSDDLEEEMQKILDDDNDKLYDNYDEFETGFNKWYSYTIKNK